MLITKSRISTLTLCLLLACTTASASLAAPSRRKLNQQQLNQVFMSAVVNGELDKIAPSLDLGAAINTPHWDGNTALMLQTGASPDNNLGKIARLLIERGANVNLRNNHGETVLILFARKGQTDIVRLLLAKGAKVNDTDFMGHTALYYATDSYYGPHPEVAKLLLAHGATPVPARKRSQTKESKSLDQKKEQLHEQLLRAIYDGSKARAESVLKKGAAINFRDFQGRTALLHVSTYDSVNEFGDAPLYMVHWLIARGADIKVRDRFGHTPLICAAASGFDSTARLLISKGANVNDRDSRGRTPLMHAAKGLVTHDGGDMSFPNMVRILLSHGASIDATDRQGQTALIWAAQSNAGGEPESIWQDEATKTVRILLARGANPSAKTHNGNTALKWATLGEHWAIAKLLKRAGARQ
jgi:serine/threonine-protein phosphatase 6 regulatory ankyrin repeat subunit B